MDVSICNLCVIAQHTNSDNLILHPPIDFNPSPWNLHSINRRINQNDIDYSNQSQKHPILLRSNNLIKIDITKELNKLIIPLKHNLYNYKDEQLIKSLLYNNNKPKLQELISPFQHIGAYKELKSSLMKPYTFKKMVFEPFQPFGLENMNNNILPFKLSTDQFGGSFPIIPIDFGAINIGKDNQHKQDREDKEIEFEVYDGYIPITLSPTIFSLQTNKFVTEINGLLYDSNIKLYNLMEKIFIKFISMFEWCLGIKIFKNKNKYKQLSVIIKMENYIFSNKNEIIGGWDCAGNASDNIIAVGLYCFDITRNKNIIFIDNSLDIAMSKCKNKSIENIKIIKNDCIVFRNNDGVKYRTKISTKTVDHNDNMEYQAISRKVLSFYLIKPDEIYKQNPNHLKYINFPWKINVFVNYFVNYKINISRDLITLIQHFTFGDMKYQRQKNNTI